MNRCVAIHINGTSEVIDVQPKVHRELRGLGYRRFVIRTADGRSPLASAVYSRTTPTRWQISDAARKLWGRNTDAVQVFDEHGEPLSHDGSPPLTTGEMQVIDAPIAAARPTPFLAQPAVPAPASVAPPRAAPATELSADLRLAAREIRGLLASRPVNLKEANQLRALADRLEAHAQTLEAQRPR